MAVSGYLVGNVAVAAGGAGVGGIAVLGTGGSRYDRLVAVTVGLDSLVVAVAADGAGEGHNALALAAGLGGDNAIVVLVAERRHALAVACAALRAAVGLGAVGRTGGCLLCDQLVVVRTLALIEGENIGLADGQTSSKVFVFLS